MTTVADVMTRDVITVHPDTPLRELSQIFTTAGIGSIPVTDAAGNLVGIVTESDLVEMDRPLHIPTVISLFDWVIYLESSRKFEEEVKKITGRTVADISSGELVTISPDASVAEAAEIMVREKVTAIPVTDGDRLVGIVARIDLIRSMVS